MNHSHIKAVNNLQRARMKRIDWERGIVIDPMVTEKLKLHPMPKCESEDLTPTPQWVNVVPYLLCIAFWLALFAGYGLYRWLR